MSNDSDDEDSSCKRQKEEDKEFREVMKRTKEKRASNKDKKEKIKKDSDRILGNPYHMIKYQSRYKYQGPITREKMVEILIRLKY